MRPGDDIVELPQADGGEGTLDAIAAASFGGATPGAEWRSDRVTGPDGREVTARRLHLPDGTAVLELAQSSGLPQMLRLDPLGATTRGLGESIRAALADGAARLVIGLGGSASTDGGAGALAELGLRLLDDHGGELAALGADLDRLAAAEASALTPAPAGGVRLLTDVTNPLLGPAGAAAVFAPQKGADPDQVTFLEQRMRRWAAAVGGDPEAAGSGAAGGTGYGFAAVWGAEIVPGSAAIAELTGLTVAAATADVLILGEGRFDATSLGGKVVGNAIGLAGPGTRVIVVAGSVDGSAGDPGGRELEFVSLSELAGSTPSAMAEPLRWLADAGALAARRDAAGARQDRIR